MKIIRQKNTIVAIDDEKEINSTIMTHLHGEMTISYDKIEEKLGKPTSKGDKYKISAEWEVITPFGMATIYDYKTAKTYCGNKEGIHYKANCNWHIGAHNQESADFIKSIFFK